MMVPIEHMLPLLIVAHYLADYPLQGDFLAKAKDPVNPIPGVPWWQAMAGHCAIQGGFVGIITGSFWLGAAEYWAHFVIDNAKCHHKISYNTDQNLHLLCKVIWFAIAVVMAQ